MENVIIIGSGPAAHTAAIYTARAKLNPLMFEGFMAGGVAAGGQLTMTTDIENYPGFPKGISGYELMSNMREQSLKFGTRIITKTVDRVDLSNSQELKVYVQSECFTTRSIIIATGATARRLRVEGEDTYWQKGISACAVCDGGLPIFRQHPVAVIGGGDSAIEEAIYMTKFASKVYLVHRRDKLRASKAMEDKMLANDKIEPLWNKVVVRACGDKLLSSIVLKDVASGEESSLEVAGMFYAVGHTPNSNFLENQVLTDPQGYILTPHLPSTQTSIKGVFVAGDVSNRNYRQAIVAAGSGCKAACDVERYLQEV